ncbi:MAG: PilZ domain-containing protein [Bdellovibrionota bacterium]
MHRGNVEEKERARPIQRTTHLQGDVRMVTSMRRQDRRVQPRIVTLNSDEITGLLVAESNFERQPFILCDVSETGIGIWTPEKLPMDSSIKVILGAEFGNITVSCQVMWCSEDPERKGFNSGMCVKGEVHSYIYKYIKEKCDQGA